jgi:uncharacterized protein YegL
MEGYQNLGMGNFDPGAWAQTTTSATLFVVVVDISGSVTGYLNIMNDAMKELFMNELKNCHKKDEISIKLITFGSKVEHKSGFHPIVNMKDDYLHIPYTMGSTALYQGVLEAFEHLKQYRDDLEMQGVNVRSNIFIITDGEDNASPHTAAGEIKKHVEQLRKDEIADTFTITMMGVGDRSSFERSCINMGLDPSKCLVTASNNAQEMRKIMGVVSQSVSSSSASNAGVTF